MATCFEKGLDEFARRLMRTNLRASRTVNQPIGTFLEITVNPFVGRFSTDVVLAAEFRNREYLS